MAVDFSPTDDLSLSNLELRSKTVTDSKNYATATNSNGDTCAESGALAQVDRYTATYGYCGSDLKTESEFLSGTPDGFFVTLTNSSYAIDGLSFEWGVDSDFVCTVTYHAHSSGESGMPGTNGGHTSLPSFDITTYIPANSAGATGVPSLADLPGITAAGDGVTRFRLDVTIDHVDVNGGTGKQLDGTSRNCRVDVTFEGVGSTPTLAAANGVTWTRDGDDQNQSLDGDTWAFRGHDYVLRT